MAKLVFSESTEIKDLYAEKIPGGYQIAFFTFELTEEEKKLEEFYQRYPALRPLSSNRNRKGASGCKSKPSTIPPVRVGKKWKGNRKSHRRMVELVKRAYKYYSIPILRSIYIQNRLADRDDYYFEFVEFEE